MKAAYTKVSLLVILIYFLSGIYGCRYLYEYEVVSDENNTLCSEILFALIVGGLFTLFYKYIGVIKNTIREYVMAVVIWSLLAFVTNNGCVKIINAIIDQQIDYPIDGVVWRKYKKEYRSATSYYVEIAPKNFNRMPYKIEISSKLYNSFNEGDAFKKKFKIGSLGIIYRLRK